MQHLKLLRLLHLAEHANGHGHDCGYAHVHLSDYVSGCRSGHGRESVRGRDHDAEGDHGSCRRCTCSAHYVCSECDCDHGLVKGGVYVRGCVRERRPRLATERSQSPGAGVL